MRRSTLLDELGLPQPAEAPPDRRDLTAEVKSGLREGRLTVQEAAKSIGAQVEPLSEEARAVKRRRRRAAMDSGAWVGQLGLNFDDKEREEFLRELGAASRETGCVG